MQRRGSRPGPRVGCSKYIDRVRCSPSLVRLSRETRSGGEFAEWREMGPNKEYELFVQPGEGQHLG